jgi:DNA end-binding protein Ku
VRNRKTGNRLKQQNVDSETGEVVSRDDMVRGYEIAKGQYMIFSLFVKTTCFY